MLSVNERRAQIYTSTDEGLVGVWERGRRRCLTSTRRGSRKRGLWLVLSRDSVHDFGTLSRPRLVEDGRMMLVEGQAGAESSILEEDTTTPTLGSFVTKDIDLAKEHLLQLRLLVGVDVCRGPCRDRLLGCRSCRIVDVLVVLAISPVATLGVWRVKA